MVSEGYVSSEQATAASAVPLMQDRMGMTNVSLDPESADGATIARTQAECLHEIPGSSYRSMRHAHQ